MSLTALRRSSRPLALWLLVVSLWGLPHRAEGADVCPPAGAEQHDESKHVFSSDVATDDAEHCAVCHWLRSLKHDLARQTSDGARPDVACTITSAASHAGCDGAFRYLATRAPPSFLN